MKYIRKYLQKNFWPSDERISKIRQPILFILSNKKTDTIGEKDELIPKEQMDKLFNKLYCKKNLLANTKIIINFYLNSNSKLEFLYFKPKNHIDNILKENIYNNKKEFYLYLRDLIFIRNSEFKKNSINYLIGNLTSYIDILKILLDNEENYIDNSCVLFK